MTIKEKMYCYYVAHGFDNETALIKAGFRNIVKAAVKMSEREDIKNEVNRLYKAFEETLAHRAKTGYERLAFSDNCDAVALVFKNELTPEDIKNSDLFCVSEIKKPKDGCIEIKFFDRIKALEKLEQGSAEKNITSSDFYNALVGGMKQTDKEGGDV